MSTFNLSSPILIVNPTANVDSTYGPYTSLADAKTAIIQGLRVIGRTVGIIENGAVVEYWWKEGITDNDLVVKTAGGSGVTDIRTGVELQFDNDAVYNTKAVPGTGNITLNPTDFKVGTVITCIHNDATEPTLFGSAVVIGGTYVVNEINYIYFHAVSTDEILVTYSKVGGLSYPTTAVFNSIQFIGGTGQQGTLSWNPDEETLDLIQNGTILQIGQELQKHVTKHGSAANIANGEVVVAVGTNGLSGKILACKASVSEFNTCTGQNVTEIPAKYVIGVATEDITNNGKVTSIGKVNDIPGATFTEGVVYYVNETTGGLTATPPVEGLKMPIAFAINSNTLMVRTTPINELDIEKGVAAFNWGDHSQVGYISTVDTQLNELSSNPVTNTVLTQEFENIAQELTSKLAKPASVDGDKIVLFNAVTKELEETTYTIDDLLSPPETTFKQVLNFTTTDTYHFSQARIYAINTAVAQPGVTVTIYTDAGLTTPYTLGTPVAAYTQLYITVDVVGIVEITIDLQGTLVPDNKMIYNFTEAATEEYVNTQPYSIDVLDVEPSAGTVTIYTDSGLTTPYVLTTVVPAYTKLYVNATDAVVAELTVNLQ